MWAVRRLFEHIARQRPLIVGFDDLQWAEPTFVELIEYVLGWTREAPILILCLARPDLLDRHPAWHSIGESIMLTPLSHLEAEELLGHLRGETEVEETLLGRITEAAEGNPLFVEQLLAMIAENGAATGDLAIPPSIHALLAARLDRLAPEERAVIEGAAVIGKEFWRGAIGRAGDRCRPRRRRSEPDDACAQGVHRARTLDLPNRGRFSLPSHLDPRRRLPRRPERDEGRAARAVRRLARAQLRRERAPSSTRSSVTTSSSLIATARSSARSARAARSWRPAPERGSRRRDAEQSFAAATPPRRRA